MEMKSHSAQPLFAFLAKALTAFAMACPCLQVCTASAQKADSDKPEAEVPSIEQTLRSIDLPLVIIHTVNGEEPTYDLVSPPEGCMGNGITNNNYVNGQMQIVEHGEVVYDSGDFNSGKGGMKLKVRGNSSAYTTCPSYKVKLSKKVDLFDRGASKYKDKEYALLNYYSTCNLKTVVGFALGRLVGMEWEPEHKFVNVLLNGKYKGLYMLAETIKRSDGRVPVASSGYLIEADPYWWNTEDVTFHTHQLSSAMAYSFKYPDEVEDQDSLTVARIQNYINHFEEALDAGGDISEWIDMESFAAWVLAHDMLGTLDGCGSNIYVMKKDYLAADSTSTKLQMGPLWDFDSCFLNEDKWASVHTINEFYFRKLFKREDFCNLYTAKWQELRDFVADSVEQVVDSIAKKHGDAINQSRKLTYEENSAYSYVSVDDDVQEVDDWFAARLPWMDAAIDSLLVEASIASPVVMKSAFSHVWVYDVAGILCHTFTSEQATRFMQAGASALPLPAGIYLVRARQTDGAIITRKCIKR